MEKVDFIVICYLFILVDLQMAKDKNLIFSWNGGRSQLSLS